MLKDCNLIFDGFTGFTPVQVNLLKALLPTDRPDMGGSHIR